jgi:hypothetical protein
LGGTTEDTGVPHRIIRDYGVILRTARELENRRVTSEVLEGLEPQVPAAPASIRWMTSSVYALPNPVERVSYAEIRSALENQVLPEGQNAANPQPAVKASPKRATSLNKAAKEIVEELGIPKMGKKLSRLL